MEPIALDFPQDIRHRALGERLYLQGASFCFKDLSIAVEALDQADSAADLDVRQRHLARARQKVERVLRVLPRLQLTHEACESILAVIEDIRERLFGPPHARFSRAASGAQPVLPLSKSCIIQ
jgi:hypothetical protein